MWNSFRPRGVKGYGIFPVVISADVAMSMHGDAERVPVEGLSKAVRIFYEAIAAMK